MEYLQKSFKIKACEECDKPFDDTPDKYAMRYAKYDGKIEKTVCESCFNSILVSKHVAEIHVKVSVSNVCRIGPASAVMPQKLVDAYSTAKVGGYGKVSVEPKTIKGEIVK